MIWAHPYTTDVVNGVTISASSRLKTAAQPRAMQEMGPSPGGAPPSLSKAAKIAATPPVPTNTDKAFHTCKCCTDTSSDMGIG